MDWYKLPNIGENKFKKAMAGGNYFPNKSDLCLFIKKANGDDPLSFGIIYVDDGGNIGTSEAIKEVIEAFSNFFKLKTMGKKSKFVGCHIIDTTDKEGVWILHPNQIKNLTANFKDRIEESARVFKTPSVPKTLIISPNPLISPEQKKTIRMVVGMFMYILVQSFLIQLENYLR
jgi:hypothetical protein